jgi:hypothetical protein
VGHWLDLEPGVPANIEVLIGEENGARAMSQFDLLRAIFDTVSRRNRLLAGGKGV